MNKNVTNSFWHMYYVLFLLTPVLIYVQIIIDLWLPHPVKSGLATAKKYNGAGRQFVSPDVYETLHFVKVRRAVILLDENWLTLYHTINSYRLMKCWFKTIIYHANLFKATKR